MDLSGFPNTEAEFRARFADDNQCREYLARLKWPEGFRCAHCAGDRAYFLPSKRVVYECAGCGRQVSVIAGTIFEQSKKPRRNRSHRRLALCPARQDRLSPHRLGVVQARSGRGRGAAPRSSDLLSAQAMDPRHPSGVGEPQTSRRLPRGVYLPFQPPPRPPDYARSGAAPRHRHDNPTLSLLENGWPPSSPRKSPTRRRSLTIMETHFLE